MLRQDRQLADDLREFAVFGGAEVKHHTRRGFRHHVIDVRIILPIQRPALVAQGIEGPDHILGGDRLAVMEPRLGPQLKRNAAVIGGQFDVSGDMGVGGFGLVGRRHRQRVVDLRRTTGGGSANDERVEAVKAADRRRRHLAALRGIRIDVGEMRETLRQCQFTDQAEAIGAHRPRGCLCKNPARPRQQGHRCRCQQRASLHRLEHKVTPATS